MDYSLEEIVALLKKRIILIVFSMAAGLLVFYLVSKNLIPPSYTATAQLYANTRDDKDLSANINALNYAQKIVSTYIYFLKTKSFYEQALEKSMLDYTWEQLQKMTEINTINNTEIFEIKVTSLLPQDSYQLAEAMQNIARELIRGIKPDTEVSIIDPAVLPVLPSSPNIPINTIIGGFLGLLLSVMASFLLDITYAKVKDVEDVKSRYHIPVLGTIPFFETKKMDQKKTERRFQGTCFAFLRKHRKILGIVSYLFNLISLKKYRIRKQGIKKDRSFIISEAFKALRTNLRFTLLSGECKKILVNSPVPEDGKSTISSNLAMSIAQTGARVLLMDCDLRKGKIHSSFHIGSTPGISDLLSDTVEIDGIVKKTNYNNLKVMPHGTVPPNSTELLASEPMEELLKELEKAFDYIIIDSAPVNIVSDSLGLVKLVDGILFVVKERETAHSEIAGALAKYELARANLLGIVVNGVKSYRSKKSYQYYYKYNHKND